MNKPFNYSDISKNGLSCVFVHLLIGGQVETCPSHQFQCASMSECLDTALVCNLVRNCADGSDEGGDCETKCPDKALCVQNCYSTPQGTVSNGEMLLRVLFYLSASHCV